MSKFKLMTLVGAFVLTAMSIMAEDKPAEQQAKPDETKEEHIQVGTRRMSQVQHIAIQEQRAKEAQEESSNDSLQACVETKSARVSSKSHNAGVFITMHQGVYYHPLTTGGVIRLHDGSHWVVKFDDLYKTANWLPTDVVVITPNQEWFSLYDYVITNQNTGVAVRVNMSLGPHVAMRHWIVGIDYFYDRVILEDGSFWSMTDSSVVYKWQVGDTVILGVNDGWFSTSYPNILINVEMLNYARGTCTY